MKKTSALRLSINLSFKSYSHRICLNKINYARLKIEQEILVRLKGKLKHIRMKERKKSIALIGKADFTCNNTEVLKTQVEIFLDQHKTVRIIS